jgi:hypothetical protein
MIRPITQLTKADTTALWYAVDAYGSMVHAMRDLPTCLSEAAIDKERQILLTAKRALRKVNAIRKTGVLQVERKTAGGAGA